MRVVAAALVLAVACASDPPPSPKVAEEAPLVIPPLPPQKEPPPRTTAREVIPAPSAGAEGDPRELTPPSPLALPCRSDAECMTHRCNLKFGKCAFPCSGDQDCVAGAMCFVQGGAMATCVPKPGP